MDSFTDYYTVLGVDAHASSDTIKAAFKKLALKYHPDVYKGEDAEERMRVLLLAYQTLSDPASRRNFDMQRAEHLMNAYGTTQNGGQRVRFGGEHLSASPDVNSASQAGQRDDQHTYAFPDLNANLSGPTWLKLGDVAYALSAQEAQGLKLDGMLRGVESQSTGVVLQVAGRPREYYCHRCHHHWVPAATAGSPSVCPACKASDWAEYLLLRCVHCHAVFESTEIRDKIFGSGRLYFPYELFPLCPNCRRSQWCLAENARLETLRAAAARRKALLLMSMVVVAMVIIGVVAVLALK